MYPEKNVETAKITKLTASKTGEELYPLFNIKNENSNKSKKMEIIPVKIPSIIGFKKILGLEEFIVPPNKYL